MEELATVAPRSVLFTANAGIRIRYGIVPVNRNVYRVDLPAYIPR